MNENDPHTKCETHDFGSEEIQFLQVYYSDKEIKGIVWQGS